MKAYFSAIVGLEKILFEGEDSKIRKFLDFDPIVNRCGDVIYAWNRVAGLTLYNYNTCIPHVYSIFRYSPLSKVVYCEKYI